MWPWETGLGEQAGQVRTGVAGGWGLRKEVMVSRVVTLRGPCSRILVASGCRVLRSKDSQTTELQLVNCYSLRVSFLTQERREGRWWERTRPEPYRPWMSVSLFIIPGTMCTLKPMFHKMRMDISLLQYIISSQYLQCVLQNISYWGQYSVYSSWNYNLHTWSENKAFFVGYCWVQLLVQLMMVVLPIQKSMHMPNALWFEKN